MSLSLSNTNVCVYRETREETTNLRTKINIKTKKKNYSLENFILKDDQFSLIGIYIHDSESELF